MPESEDQAAGGVVWKSVFSEVAARVGYDTDKQELYVEWARTGKVTVYSGVPAELADELSKTISVGSMLSERIKGHYPFRYE